MNLKVTILSEKSQPTLAAFLSHIGCDTKQFVGLTEFFTEDAKVKQDLLFIDKAFLNIEEKFTRLRKFLSLKKDKAENIKVYIIGDDYSVVKIPHSGLVSSDDLNAIKKITEETKEKISMQDSLGFSASSEEIIEVEEDKVVDESKEKLLLSLEKMNGSQSFDELGVNLCLGLNNILLDKRKGIFFKYLPTYCSLVALGGINIESRKVNGVGVNFSESKDFSPTLHLSRLMQVETFTRIVEKIIGHKKVDIYVLDIESQARGVLVIEKPPIGGADYELKVAVSYGKTKLSEIEFKNKYKKNQTYDELTGCILKDGFFTQLQNEIIRSRRVLLPVTVMFIEIDDFYGIKARYNTERIKVLIKSFSKVLKDNIRHNDLVGKISENRFAVLFPHMSTEDAKEKAKKIVQILKQTQFFSDMKTRLVCTASIAFGTYPSQVASADELIVSLGSLLNNKEFSSLIKVLEAKPGFIPDFKELKLPKSINVHREA